MESVPCQYVAQDFERVKKLTPFIIYKLLPLHVNTVPSTLTVHLHADTIYDVI
jgi:hypothetical protein